MLSLLHKYSGFLSEYFPFSQHDLIKISSLSCPITGDQTLNISNGSFVGRSLNDKIRAYSSRSVVTPVGCSQSSCSDLLSIQVEFIIVNHPAWSPRSRLRKQSKLEMAALLNLFRIWVPPAYHHIHLISSFLLPRDISVTTCCSICTIPKIFMNLKAGKLVLLLIHCTAACSGLQIHNLEFYY